MELKLVSIKNWRNIKNIDIHFNDLMIFLGQSIEGTNDLISAILFAFNHKKFNSDDIFSENEKCILKFIFFEKGSVYKLKIVGDKNENINYSLRVKNIWKDISFDDYIKFISKINFIHISGTLENDYKKIGKDFYEILKNNPKKTEEIEKLIKDFYDKINDGFNDKEIYRNILFEFFRLITLESLDKKSTLLDKTIILFEEPELYLHPQMQRELYNYFIKLTNRKTKIYIKTYSSCFLGLKQYKSICLIKKINDIVYLTQTDKKLFQNDDIKIFNMNYWINPDRAELFFAKKVILVEGQTDKIVISFLAKKLEIFKYDYSIIECGSKSSIPQFINLLNNFKIPYIAVYDKDNHHWRTFEEIENSNLKNNQIRSLINKDFGSSLAFDNDIEEEIYSKKNERIAYKNKPFNALKYISEDEYQIPQKLENKIKNIYS